MKLTQIIILAGCLLAEGSGATPLQAQDFTFTTVAGGTQGSLDGNNSNAQFYDPTGVAVDSAGNLYVADQKNNSIREITPQGTNWIVTTIAGGAEGSLDGTNTSAQFSSPTGIALDSATNLYVADQFNYTIRKITPVGTNWVVSTIAGQAGVSGAEDGTNNAAQFYNPAGVAVDNAGNIFVADEFNNAIRKIAPSGTNWIVTTIAGGSLGAADGTNTAAQFFYPTGVAVDANDLVFVADQFNNAIRLVTPVGSNWVVTTIAGQPTSGSSNGLGTNALFDAPVGLAVDSNDDVFVADSFNEAIRLIVPSSTNWQVFTIAGGAQGSNDGTGTNASFDLPFGVALDSFGDVFVADSQNNAIRLGISTNAPAATGSLEVLITPPSAVSAGAEWQLDGTGPFLTNGTILTNLAPGDHGITFSNIVGFTTPAPQTVPVTIRQTNVTTGNYQVVIPNDGSLQVAISPAGAVDAGGEWQVDGGDWQTNGAVVAGLPVGSYTLSFSNINGWTTPSNQTVAVASNQTTFAEGIYVLQTGSLQVSILPSAVNGAGAEWQVDNSAWQTNGAVVANLSVGSHTLSFFSPVAGWTAPSSQIVTISNNQTTLATGTYTAQTGSLQVTILPSAAVSDGAVWQVDSNAWQASGNIVAGLSVGSHSLTFSNIYGWTTPSSQTVTISNAQTTLATGTYVAQTGSLQVTILPSAVVTAGALWQVDSNAWQSNQAVVAGLSVGSHTLSFTNIFGWTTPSSQSVAISNNQTTLATGTYVLQTGSLQVSLHPIGAVNAGAEWQVDTNGAWQTNGTVVTNLAVGFHSLSFSNITGWTTPSSQTVTISNNQTTQASGTYTTAIPNAGSLQVTILPPAVVTAGAQWQVDASGIWQTNGAVVAGLSVGEHLLSFTNIAGWTTPSNQAVSITNSQTTAATGTYSLQTGSLQVTISPPGAVLEGAQWQVDDNGLWQTNEAIVSGLSLGEHVLSFTNLAGWMTPSNQTVSISNGQTTLATGDYILQTGSLQVTISPTGAVLAGAQWQVDGSGFWQTNDAIVTGLSVGEHLLSFTNIAGWTTPSNQTVSITNTQTTLATGTYILQAGFIQVTISPSGAVAAGAQWQLDGGPGQISGAALGNLSAGNHTLSFTPIFKWVTPASQIVTTTNGAPIFATGVYAAFTNSSDGLDLLTNGYGTIKHAAWPASLVIGKKYTVDATPKPGNIFTLWSGGTNLPYSLSNLAPSYTFTMESNLVLEATFVTNVFLAAQGTYAGLFAPANSARQQSNSGSFSFTVNSTGKLSGKLALDGQTVPLSGKFDLGGSAEIVSPRPHGQPSLTTTLQLDFTGQSVSGIVSNNEFTSELSGNQQVFNRLHPATEFEGRYTMIIPGTNDPAVGPFGVSYATVTVSSLGAITLAGSLADGTALSQSSSVSQNGYWPLYVDLYLGKGSLWGWIYFTNQTIVAAPWLSWINATNSSRTAVYRSGFTNQQAALAGGLVNNTLLLPLPVTLQDDEFTIAIPNLEGNTNKLTLRTNQTTGVVSGSFANPDEPGKTIKVNGVIVHGDTNAQGYFLGTGQSGSFTLGPP